MKIKGSYRKDQKSGKRKGDAIEFTPEEKVPHAVAEAMKVIQPKGSVFLIQKVTFENLKVHAKSTDKSTFANNVYTCNGVVKFKRHNLEGNKLYPTEELSFTIEFEDSSDMGQPDLKINNFAV